MKTHVMVVESKNLPNPVTTVDWHPTVEQWQIRDAVLISGVKYTVVDRTWVYNDPSKEPDLIVSVARDNPFRVGTYRSSFDAPMPQTSMGEVR